MLVLLPPLLDAGVLLVLVLLPPLLDAGVLLLLVLLPLLLDAGVLLVLVLLPPLLDAGEFSVGAECMRRFFRLVAERSSCECVCHIS